ncbi:hypothetical protein [Erythrobacter sp. SD-21]|uniref:hypothetical protein n=1 Tax=Erythrobacter sp. SD-21 TaxID=161528 RepID=UPI000153F049|nr:hypothetical protein [Erythrobacter sp. SD-21]EDL50115.1 hypothetical protein ED21_26628 [Erythrobacter sp. SD-21]
MTTDPLRITAILLLAAATTACSPVTEEAVGSDPPNEQLLRSVQANAKPDPGENCLLMAWSEQDNPDIEFDRAHDAVKGGAISCATGTTPSQFETAISALREAAESGDRARILEQVGIPLLYIDEEGERHELSREQIDMLFDDIFNERMLDLLQRLDLSQMTVEKDQGAFFELGSLWLVVDDGGRPRVMTVNSQALDEAAMAARNQAERGQGEALKGG